MFGDNELVGNRSSDYLYSKLQPSVENRTEFGVMKKIITRIIGLAWATLGSSGMYFALTKWWEAFRIAVDSWAKVFGVTAFEKTDPVYYLLNGMTMGEVSQNALLFLLLIILVGLNAFIIPGVYIATRSLSQQ